MNLNDLKEFLKRYWVMLFALVLFVFTWFFLEENYITVWIKLVFLFLFVLIWVIILIMDRDKEDTFYSKTFVIYLTIFLFLMGLVYLFNIINQVMITQLITVLTAAFALFLFFISMFKNLIQSKGKSIIEIILNYIGLVGGVIMLFGFLYATFSGFPGNGLGGPGLESQSSASDNLYFSSVTFYSLGYGDLYPKGNWMRFVSQIEVLLGVIIHIIILGWLISSYSKNPDDFW